MLNLVTIALILNKIQPFKNLKFFKRYMGETVGMSIYFFVNFHGFEWLCMSFNIGPIDTELENASKQNGSFRLGGSRMVYSKINGRNPAPLGLKLGSWGRFPLSRNFTP